PLMPEQQQQYIEQNVMPRIEETNKLAGNLDYLYSQDATSVEGSKNIQDALSDIDRTKLTDEARTVYDLLSVTSNISQMNIPKIKPTAEQIGLTKAKARGERLAEEDKDDWWTTKLATIPVNIGSAVGREGTRLVSGILGIPEYANDLVAGAINAGVELLGGDPDAIPKWDETYGETPIDKYRSFLNQAVERNIEK